MRRLGGLAPLVLAMAMSCGGEPTAPIDRQTFEDVMVELRTAGQESDSAAFIERRREILEAAGVTDSLLYSFVQAYVGNVEYMVEVWESIDVRVNGPPVDSDTLSVR